MPGQVGRGGPSDTGQTGRVLQVNHFPATANSSGIFEKWAATRARRHAPYMIGERAAAEQEERGGVFCVCV